MSCKYCANGKINEYGDEWFARFECTTYGALYREKPRITKRNNRYFLHVDTSLSMIPIKACPICGRSLVEGKYTYGKEELIDKVATEFEERWDEIKDAWLACDRSEQIRQMIIDALDDENPTIIKKGE